jgi:hypothetical protein
MLYFVVAGGLSGAAYSFSPLLGSSLQMTADQHVNGAWAACYSCHWNSRILLLQQQQRWLLMLLLLLSCHTC